MSFRLAFLLLIPVCGLIHCQPAEMKHAYTNKLIDETSPYLLQHAHNPVDWHAWNEESLAKAKTEKKLIIISIGYSSCHWCHVMEHESFEDSAVAAIMNEHFINIKVDREERPDIDDIYMTACQLSKGGGCGWPLNSFALPDGRPVWAGTYFPKDNWMEILAYFQKTYEEEPQKLYDYAAQLVAGVQAHGLDTILTGDEPAIKKEDAATVTKVFLSAMDPRLGGRRGAPKFPMPNNVQYLMHYAKRYGDKDAANQAITTLDNMMEGGIYDQLEGGFARYSTDDKWLVPHFEKMLYDNGQLISLYANAFAWTGNQSYLDIVTQTIEFANTYWLDPAGGYYSSFDADSEDEEGKYYVWSMEELEQLLPDTKEQNIFFTYYDIQQNGNWEDGKNILHRSRKTDVIAKQHNISEEQVHSVINAAHKKLLAARKKRIAPGLDDKILASWNGLMLQGLIDAYKASGDARYLEQALRNGRFIKKHLIKEGNRLDRNYKNGRSTINGFLDDYAAVIQGMLALYQSTFDISWLETANGLTEHVMTHFDGGTGGLFYYTSDLDPPLVARRIDLSDNVIPSSNSMMARNLLVLGELMYRQEYIERAHLMMSSVWPMILRDKQPSFYSNWCQLMLNIIQPPFEVAIVGDQYSNPLTAMQRSYQPDALYLGGKDDSTLPLLEDKLLPGETLIYVCQNKVCKMPTPDVVKALSLLEQK